MLMKKLIAIFALILTLCAPAALFAEETATPSPDAAAPAAGEKVLRWGGDSEGGFPYMFPDPQDPKRLIGFEVDIVNALAKEMGRTPVYVNNAWDNLIPGLDRNLYDIAINGLEVTPEHEGEVNFSIPYYKTFLQLAVRREDDSIKGLQDLKGKIAGTLKESYAQMVLEEVGDVEIRTYIVEANTYEDLANGRLDAALFDQPIALYSAGFNPEIKFVGEPIGEIIYAIAMRKSDTELTREVNRALIAMRDKGILREIYDRWNLWTPVMAETFNDYDPPKVEPARYNEWAEAHRPQLTLQKRLERYWEAAPLFARGAVVTIEVSIVSMVIAMALGLALAVTRVFAPKWMAMIATAYVEIIRGTPLLIQLFFIFYGLPSVGIKLSPFWAGAIGLGLNYDDALAGDARGHPAAGHPRRNPADKQRLHIAAQGLLARLHHHDGRPHESLRPGLRNLLRLFRPRNPRRDNLPPDRPPLRALLALHGKTPRRLRKGRPGRPPREHLQKQHEILLTA